MLLGRPESRMWCPYVIGRDSAAWVGQKALYKIFPPQRVGRCPDRWVPPRMCKRVGHHEKIVVVVDAGDVVAVVGVVGAVVVVVVVVAVGVGVGVVDAVGVVVVVGGGGVVVECYCFFIYIYIVVGAPRLRLPHNTSCF